MNVLVTGHRGFVGSHLVPFLRERGHRVIGCDLREGQDVCTAVLLPAESEVDRVFHLAAQTDARCEDAEGDAYTNIMGTIRLMRRFGKKVVFASSSMVKYPQCPYAISKLAAEQYVRHYGGGVIRFCNLWGPGGHSVIDRFVRDDPVTVFGSGEQRRTYQHVTVAVNVMYDVQPGQLVTLKGEVHSVNDLALDTGKKISRQPARRNDLLDAT